MKRQIEVRMLVDVETDDAKFTPEFMSDFRESFYPFTTIAEHAEHIAQLCARGLFGSDGDFIEGYGPADEMGIRARVTEMETELCRE